MKTILTLILIIAIGNSANAQVDVQDTKEALVEKKEVTVSQSEQKGHKPSLARVYLYKNSRVKKELGFKTKKNKSKLA